MQLYRWIFTRTRCIFLYWFTLCNYNDSAIISQSRHCPPGEIISHFYFKALHKREIRFLNIYFLSDIDECITGDFNCDLTVSTCSNTPGSYTCTCNTGYTGSNGYCVGQWRLSITTRGSYESYNV